MATSIKNLKKPIILRRMILKSQQTNRKVPIRPDIRPNRKVIKVATIPLYREDVIFESKGETFLAGEFRSVVIINKLNNLTNNCQTIAKFVTHSGDIVEKTSDILTELIGQETYNTLFYALCSVINQEYRIKGILALLTPIKKKELFKLPPSAIQIKCQGIDKACQTNETRLEFKQKKVRRRVRKVLVPYVVKPDNIKPNKCSVPRTETEELSNFIQNQMGIEATEADVKSEPFDRSFETETEETNSETTLSSSESGKSLPDLGFLQDDNSNDSVKTFSTLHSFKTLTDLLINPISLVNNVELHTKENNQIVLPNHMIRLMDGTELKVPFKPEDDFHIATKENLQFLDELNRKKLLWHQMQIDYKHCCIQDEDGNVVIHLAVINDDIELLKRQCVVLKMRHQSVDIPASNGLTALKLSLFRETASATSVLLQHGADPFLTDDDHRTCAHIAAELKTDHLSIILNHCKLNAREIIIQHAEDLQKPGWQERSDEELASSLINYMCCSVFDKQGYNPLMLASKLGLYENVRLLLEVGPSCVNLAMPNSGNTALYLAVAASCTLAAERGNRTKVVDHFRKTLEILLEYGADPSIDNSSGSNVNILLQEFNCAELSMLVANKVTCTKYFKGQMDPAKNFDSYHLLKDGNNITIAEMDSKNDKSALIKLRKDKVQIPVKKLIPNTITVTKEQMEKQDFEPKIVENDKSALIKFRKDKVKIPVKKLIPNTITVTNEQMGEQDFEPMIIENILLKSSLNATEKQNTENIKIDKSKSVESQSSSPVSLKDFVIEPSVKEVTTTKMIWCAKRNADEEKTDAKRIKTKK